VCADHEVSKSIETNTIKSHEHARVVQVMVFQVIGGWVIFDECVTVGEPHHDDQ
jgi:hypothetical protein